MQQLLVVGLGGCLGAIARYSLTGLVQRKFSGPFPLGTLVVNAVGCLLIGMVMAFVADARTRTGQPLISITTQRLLITGFLGSLTTFSTFGYETVELLREREVRLAFWNIAANCVVGLSFVWLGRVAMRPFL